MKRILFLRNKIDVPARYNYALNYGWVDKGASEGLYTAFDWYIDDIPTQDEMNAYIADNEIDAIISLCANEARFAAFLASDWWRYLVYGASVPTILRASDGYKHSWKDPFYQAWDYILYNCADKNGEYPDWGAFLPWCIDIEKYTPVYGGDQIVMACTATAAYPLRVALRELNGNRAGPLFLDMCNKEEVKGDAYIECLQNARAIIATGSVPSPETKGKVLEAAACGALVITSPTSNLDRYFDEDQVFVFHTGQEFIDICQRVREMSMDEVIERQQAVYQHVSQNHNCIEFINDHILPAVRAAKEPSHVVAHTG